MVNLATLGAAVGVLSIVIGAFTQQAIQTISCQKPSSDGQASIPIAQTLPTPRNVGGIGEPDAGLRASLIAGLAGLQSPNSLSPTCSSGNCTFQATEGIKYTSVGLSSECIDISSLITQGGSHSWVTNVPKNEMPETLYTTYSLPNGQSIQYDLGTNYILDRWDTMLARTAGVLDLENVTMTERQRHIVSNSAMDLTADNMIFLMPTTSPCSNASDYEFYLGNTSLPMPSISSSECPQLWDTLPGVSSIPGYFSVMAAICYNYPSIQNYDGSVINGKLVEQSVEDPVTLDPLGPGLSTVAVPAGSQKWTTDCDSMCGFADPCIVDNIVYKNTSANFTDVPGGLALLNNVTGPYRCLYGMPAEWGVILGDVMLTNIIFATDGQARELNETCWALSNYTSMVCPRAWWLSGIYNGGNASVASINAFMKRGFDSLTSQLRSIGVDWDGNPTVATGTSYKTSVCIQFRWEWLLYPLAVVIGTLILLLAIISSSGFLGHNREVIWKTSIFPLLFYGLEDGRRKEGMELEPEGALKKAASPMRVRFTSGDDGWRLHTS